jgi:hypothetical protein
LSETHNLKSFSKIESVHRPWGFRRCSDIGDVSPRIDLLDLRPFVVGLVMIGSAITTTSESLVVLVSLSPYFLQGGRGDTAERCMQAEALDAPKTADWPTGLESRCAH